MRITSLHVLISGLPDCPIDADNRDNAIRLACEAIAAIMSRSKVVQVDVSQLPMAPSTRDDIPWEWFGAAKDNVAWETLFDGVERNREATRETK